MDLQKFIKAYREELAYEDSTPRTFYTPAERWQDRLSQAWEGDGASLSLLTEE